MDGNRPTVVLLVEDNENDVMLTKLSLKRAKLAVDLHHAADGVECMEFLRKQGKFSNAPTPDLILLDLNMPRMDGREVMTQLVADPELCHLPVVVLTTSNEESEVFSLYKLRCSSYIVKPIDFDQFARVVRLITDYWFTVVALPTRRAGVPVPSET